MDIYKPAKFASEIGVSTRTLRRWDTTGVLRAHRMPSGRPYYTNLHYTKCTKLGLNSLKKGKTEEQLQKLLQEISSEAC